MTRGAWIGLFAASVACAVSCSVVAQSANPSKPSRPPFPKCAWEPIADVGIGLAAWVQRCDYGFRKIDFLFREKSLAIRYSDGGGPDPVVDVIDLLPGEGRETGVRRVFAEQTESALAKRCVMAPFREAGSRTPAGVRRYVFVPGPAYRRELKAKESPDEVGDPPCGVWGVAPDGIQYFEVHSKSPARKILFVRVGQDEPLFDAQTLRLLESR